MARAISMKDKGLHKRELSRGQQAEELVVEIFGRAGWQVRREPHKGKGQRPDLIVRRGRSSYAVEVKVAPEGRSDRLVPLWSQAYLQAVRAAGQRHAPLVVVAAPHIARRVAESVLRFANEYAADAAAGVIDFEGLRMFRGPRLDDLSSGVAHVPSHFPPPRRPADLFSDLNQWMLKVLLAPEIPEALLSAPRGRFRNASELARAAQVSVMSAFRFVRLLQQEGYLRESESSLALARREDLFRRWQSWSASRPVREAPMRFLLHGDPAKELHHVLLEGHACLALFAAADVLGLGFVHGVPPHVYVERLRPRGIPRWKNIVPADGGEPPDLIFREALAAQSVFRGMVKVEGKPVSDVLQVWLDVSAHPSRGREQADLIRRRLLDKIIRRERAGG